MKLLNLLNQLIFSFRKIQGNNCLGNVLIVSNTGFGDTLLSTPAIKTLKKNFPNTNVTFLVNKKYFQLFENYKYVNNIWKYTGSYLNLFSIVIWSRKARINSVILLHSNGPEDIFISLLSGARNILKWTDNINHEYRSLFLNGPADKLKHNIEKKIDLIRYFGVTEVDTTMSIADKYYRQKQRYFYSDDKKKIVGIQLGAQDIYKVWPIENIIKLSHILINKGCFLLFFGATSFESEMALQVRNSINQNNFMDLCCKTKIEELPSILKSIDILITNDTGILHLAIAIKVKTLSLFSPTSSIEFGAYQDRELHYSIQKNGFFVNYCSKKLRSQEGMKLITVDEVESKVSEIICLN